MRDPPHFISDVYKRQVNSVIVEYIEGIEGVKAFNQTSGSYEKYAGAVKSFRDFTMAWFRSTWVPMNLTFAILPTTLLGTLPVGVALYPVSYTHLYSRQRVLGMFPLPISGKS